MRTNFSKMIAASAVLAVAAMVGVTAKAETTVKIPFSFRVGDKECPAGSYVVSNETGHNQVVLRGGKRAFVWITSPADVAAGRNSVTLKFDVMAADHALRTVQYGKGITSRLDEKLKPSEHQPVETVTNE